MKIGTTPIVSVKSGNTPIQKVYSGVNLIWSSVDPDAQAFITAASITDPTQQSAINQLVTDLKGYGVWTKMKALYPFVGNTASQHKFNLKDPRDLDAAYRLVFFGGVTHDSNGVTGNGTNGYIDTKLNDSLVLQKDNASLSSYSRSNIQRGSDSFYSTNDPSVNAIYLNPRNASSNINLKLHQTPATDFGLNADSRGFYTLNRTASNILKLYKNSIVFNSSTISTDTQNSNIFLFKFSGSYSERNLAFQSIGDGLTDTEAANFYTLVNNFQVALSRNV